MELPSISTYGEHTESAYRVDVGPLTIWFSYKTPVAFRARGGILDRVIRQNEWKTTTGKNLNWIDGGTKEAKAKRVDSATFQRLWDEQVAPLLSSPITV